MYRIDDIVVSIVPGSLDQIEAQDFSESPPHKDYLYHKIRYNNV